MGQGTSRKEPCGLGRDWGGGQGVSEPGKVR